MRSSTKYLHLPTEDFFCKTPPLTPLEIQLSLIPFFKYSGLTGPPTPKEIPIPSEGGGSVDIF